MNKVQEALKAASEALEKHQDCYGGHAEIVELCKSALSEIEKREPVAWMAEDGLIVNVHQKSIMHKIASDNHYIPIYTSPISKEWLGLSADDELHLKDAFEFHGNEFLSIRETEAKLKQLNAPEKG